MPKIINIKKIILWSGEKREFDGPQLFFCIPPEMNFLIRSLLLPSTKWRMEKAAHGCELHRGLSWPQKRVVMFMDTKCRLSCASQRRDGSSPISSH